MKRAGTEKVRIEVNRLIPFTVTYSTLDAEELLKFAIKKWNRKPGSEIVLLKRGMNDTYLITEPSGKKFILRIYSHKWRSILGINDEVGLIERACLEKQFNLPALVKTKIKPALNIIPAPEGIRVAVMYTFAPGKVVRKLTTTQAKLLGKETAKMHKFLKKETKILIDYNYDIDLQFENTLAVLKPILAEHKEQYEYLNKLKKDFVKTFKEVKKEDLSFGLCHGDLQPENIHFTDDNKVIFFDFDLMGKGFQAYDIGVFMWYDHKNKTPEIIKSFLEGYESIRKLSVAEHRLLPYFSTLRAMFQMTLYCKTNNGKHLPLWKPEEVASFVNKIKQWHESKRKA